MNKEETEFTPHSHRCEIKMVKKHWEQYCPYKGRISEEKNECDSCEHLIVVEFWDNEMTKIRSIYRND